MTKTLSRLTRIIAACACLGFFGCSTSRPPAVYPDYSTAYLGPNGEIVFAPAPRGATKPTAPTRSEPGVAWTWTGDDVSGSPSIRIDLSQQEAVFYKGGVEVGRAPVSTGREGYHTPTGSFRVIQKNADHISNLYGDYVDYAGNVVKANVGVNRDRRPPGTQFRGAPMPYFMRVNGAVGMHAGYLPGYPASHGCIRLPRGAAEVFFQNAPVGTPVTIAH